jgi:hypothetical protein
MNIRLRPTRTRIASTSEAFPPCHRQLTPELNFLVANSGIHRSRSAICAPVFEAGQYLGGQKDVRTGLVADLICRRNQ